MLGECIGLGNRKPYQHHVLGSHNHVWSFGLFFFFNMAFDVPEKPESAPTLAASSPSLLSVADGQPAYSQRKSRPRALLSPLTKENVPEGPKRAERAGSSLCPSFYVSVWHWAVHLRHLWASVSSPDIRLGLKLSKAITSCPHRDIPGTRGSAVIWLRGWAREDLQWMSAFFPMPYLYHEKLRHSHRSRFQMRFYRNKLRSDIHTYNWGLTH